jgi:hypothetical protein
MTRNKADSLGCLTASDVIEKSDIVIYDRNKADSLGCSTASDVIEKNNVSSNFCYLKLALGF